MEIVLNEQDIKRVEDMIKVTPFEFAYPLFQFFRAKANEAQRIEQEKNKKENTKSDEPQY
jgi:hypothetical protein